MGSFSERIPTSGLRASCFALVDEFSIRRPRVTSILSLYLAVSRRLSPVVLLVTEFSRTSRLSCPTAKPDDTAGLFGAVHRSTRFVPPLDDDPSVSRGTTLFGNTKRLAAGRVFDSQVLAVWSPREPAPWNDFEAVVLADYAGSAVRPQDLFRPRRALRVVDLGSDAQRMKWLPCTATPAGRR
jgi:hypothetical protein